MLFATWIDRQILFFSCRVSVIFCGVMQDGIRRLTTSMPNAAAIAKLVDPV